MKQFGQIILCALIVQAFAISTVEARGGGRARSARSTGRGASNRGGNSSRRAEASRNTRRANDVATTQAVAAPVVAEKTPQQKCVEVGQYGWYWDYSSNQCAIPFTINKYVSNESDVTSSSTTPLMMYRFNCPADAAGCEIKTSGGGSIPISPCESFSYQGVTPGATDPYLPIGKQIIPGCTVVARNVAPAAASSNNSDSSSSSSNRGKAAGMGALIGGLASGGVAAVKELASGNRNAGNILANAGLSAVTGAAIGAGTGALSGNTTAAALTGVAGGSLMSISGLSNKAVSGIGNMFNRNGNSNASAPAASQAAAVETASTTAPSAPAAPQTAVVDPKRVECETTLKQRIGSVAEYQIADCVTHAPAGGIISWVATEHPGGAALAQANNSNTQPLASSQTASTSSNGDLGSRSGRSTTPAAPAASTPAANTAPLYTLEAGDYIAATAGFSGVSSYGCNSTGGWQLMKAISAGRYEAVRPNEVQGKTSVLVKGNAVNNINFTVEVKQRNVTVVGNNVCIARG